MPLCLQPDRKPLQPGRMTMENPELNDSAKYINPLDKCAEKLKSVLENGSLSTRQAEDVAYALGAVEYIIAQDNIEYSLGDEKMDWTSKVLPILPMIVDLIKGRAGQTEPAKEYGELTK